MEVKFDSVTSPEFSKMRPQEFIRAGNRKFPTSTIALRRFEFQERRQFFVRAHNEALTITAIGLGNEDTH
jgi:hypothetical protein